MTYRKLAPWPSQDDLMEMQLRQRVRFVRKNLATKKKDAREPWMTLDEFAQAVGATGRHRVIGWEKKGERPRDYAEKIAALTPYPATVFGADGGEELEWETRVRRLRSLEAEVRWLRGQLTRAFGALEIPLEPPEAEPLAQSGGAPR